MAKKKQTLKDLNDFMKNEGVKENEEQDFMSKKPTVLANVEKLRSDVDKLAALPANSLYEKEIVELITKVAEAAELSPRHILFNVVESVLENQKDKDAIDLLLENNIALLKYHQSLIDHINS